ncbi:MAG: hypothetical protein ACREXS_09300, partial [Gammaproteobacteria bacterium]
MRIIADPNIAYVRDAFGALGALRLVAGRDWSPEIARDDLLRSCSHISGLFVRPWSPLAVVSPTFSTGGDQPPGRRINRTVRSIGLHYKWVGSLQCTSWPAAV